MSSKVARLCKMTGILLLAILYLLLNNLISVECIFKKISGIPCVGCGTTRALTSLVKGDIGNALYYNPVAILLAVLFGIMFIICVKDVLFSSSTADKVLHRRLTKIEYALIILVFLANWLFNIVKFK